MNDNDFELDFCRYLFMLHVVRRYLVHATPLCIIAIISRRMRLRLKMTGFCAVDKNDQEAWAKNDGEQEETDSVSR